MTLVLRKLLASSSFAIAGALGTLISRMKEKLTFCESAEVLSDQLEGDYEALNETAEEWTNDPGETAPLSPENRGRLEKEISDLETFRSLAVSITHNAKGRALLAALERAFAEATRLGAAKKAIIFTESRRTQEYLQRLLSESPYGNGVVLFNGSNSDQKSRDIYTAWLQRHTGTDRVTGSRTADMRSALVDYFRDSGQIMIATEAGAEGINLQFCSLVVNYDLPWNPQRIEQRIGRCHRYGQKHDVVVVNFLNKNNEADQRVFQLLAEKFSLFEGVFGASDEVLGAIESGVDFEKRIADIYQRCRTPDEIRTLFDKLQLELAAQIDDAMTRTRRQLLENFDAEVHEKLRVNLDQSRDYLNRYERMLMELTRYELDGQADFLPSQSSFQLRANPFPEVADIPVGLYELPRRTGESHLYRLGHPLAKCLMERAKARTIPYAELTFDHTALRQKIAAIEPFVGQCGELLVVLFTIDSLSQAEDHLLIAAITDTGRMIDQNIARWFFSLPATKTKDIPPATVNPALQAEIERRQAAIRQSISERNGRVFEAEATKLDHWADDLKLALEQEIKDLDRQIKEAKRTARAAVSLEEKLAGQRQIKSLESQRNAKRKSLFEAQDAVDQRREALIAQIEAKLTQNTSADTVMFFRWRLV